MKPKVWPRCWKRVPAPLLRAIGREAHLYGHSNRKTIPQCPSGYAGHELRFEINQACASVSDDKRERALVGASMFYSLAAVGDYVGEVCCRRRGCTQPTWPSFDGVCFEHGMEELS